MRTVIEIHSSIDEINKKIADEAAKPEDQVNHADIIAWRKELEGYDTELQEALKAEQAQQERVQAQQVAVESIVLPYDFNEVLENTAANDMIIEVVKDFQRQAYAKHNEEIDELKAQHRANLEAADEREAQLHRQNMELQIRMNKNNEQAIADADEFLRLEKQIAQLLLDKQAAEAKVAEALATQQTMQTEIARLQSQIAGLRTRLADAPAPKQALDITPTDKLAQMVKDSAAEKAQKAVERWNRDRAEHAVQPLALPELPAAEVTQHDFRSGDQAAQDHTMVHEGTGPTEQANSGVSTPESAVTRAEHEALAARVDRIERHANLPVAV